VERKLRLSFGEVAELYDQSRPSYPGELVDDVIALAGGAPGVRALEVGAGTGKATVMFAARGLAVHGLEPSPEMAAIARRNCAPFPDVTIEEADFERWTVEQGVFALVFSAQAWHWVTPELKYVRARAALADGGRLAAFWNRPRWEDSPLREDLSSVYLEFAPDLGPDPGPADPALNTPPDRWEDWDAEIEAAAGFGRPEVRFYEWTSDYTAEEYTRLLSTHSDHIVLPDDRHAALMAAVAEVIERHGGTLRMYYVTKLCVAVAL
jgi:SAM-dependent methyltransferase